MGSKENLQSARFLPLKKAREIWFELIRRLLRMLRIQIFEKRGKPTHAQSRDRERAQKTNMADVSLTTDGPVASVRSLLNWVRRVLSCHIRKSGKTNTLTVLLFKSSKLSMSLKQVVASWKNSLRATGF